MGTAQVTFTAEELLASHDYAEPLFANGIACHGGFDEDGTYVSPRTRFRGPAIEAWEAKRVEDFGTDPLHIPIDAWPRSFPNVEQTKFLVRHGITEPTIAALTRIGTVEGFGAMMRFLPLPDFQTLFVESIEGTATEHIPKGLFEAHARDEAGWEAEAGHNTMWFAARDIAFENPVTEDMTQQMLTRMGIIPPSGGAPAQTCASGSRPGSSTAPRIWRGCTAGSGASWRSRAVFGLLRRFAARPTAASTSAGSSPLSIASPWSSSSRPSPESGRSA